MAEDGLTRLEEMAQRALEGGGAHKRRPGALSPHARLELLFDAGSFKQTGRFALHDCRDFGMEDKRFLGDGLVTGFGQVNGRTVMGIASDWTVVRGTWSQRQCEKIVEAHRMAGQVGAPVVSLVESAGARLQEGIRILEDGARTASAIYEVSGVVPMLTGVMGSCFGLPALGALGSDFLCMLEGKSSLCVAGPDVVRVATGEEVDEQSLGGSRVHTEITGHAHAALPSEAEVVGFLKELLSFLPSNNAEPPPLSPTDDPPDRKVPQVAQVLPTTDAEAFDIRALIRLFADDGHFLELQRDYARNGVIGFARFGGQPVGVVANQSLHLAGALDVDVAKKFTRFINTLNCFNLPLVTFLDVPGVLPGRAETHKGALAHSVQLVSALVGCRSPKVSVIVRRCYGGAWIMASSKAAQGDLVFAYPGATLGAMSPEALGRIVFKGEPPPEVVAEVRKAQNDPFVAAGLGHLDDVIRPEDTRAEICRGLRLLQSKRVVGKSPRRMVNVPL